jgi:hypothetical protein
VAPKPGGPSFEPAAFYLACAVLFLLAGPGRFSLDAMLFGGIDLDDLARPAPAAPGPAARPGP